jgi:hypothetical protein
MGFPPLVIYANFLTEFRLRFQGGPVFLNHSDSLCVFPAFAFSKAC